jgi:acyl-CoA synthetase (AMP-forming)/AMP-acid ligase II
MRSLAAVVDTLAAEVPNSIWAKIALSIDDGADPIWQDVTWIQLAQAVGFMAHWIQQNLGPAMGSKTIAYTGVADIRYHITILASIKTGHKVIILDNTRRETSFVNKSLSFCCHHLEIHKMGN